MTKNGPAVQKGDIDAGDNPEWGTLKEGQKLYSITLEEALGLFKTWLTTFSAHTQIH